MPKKLQEGRSATAERIAALIRIYRAASLSGDVALKDASVVELRRYGVDVALFDDVDLANAAAPPVNKGGAI